MGFYFYEYRKLVKPTVFKVNNQTLINSRWENVLPTLPDQSVDLFLSDPPYATTALKWDKKVDLKALWIEIRRVCKPLAPIVMFCSGKFVPVLLNSNLKEFRYELIWEKNLAVGFLDANRRPLRAHEQIFVFCQKFRGSIYNPQKVRGKMHTTGGRSKKSAHYAGANRTTKKAKTNLYHPRSVLKYSNVVKGKSLHPTAKPLELVEWLVRTYSNPGDFVLDPFVGSGTTLAAAMLNDRRGLGIEREPDYFETAKSRLIELEKVLKNE